VERLGLVLGVIGTATSILALFYAFLAARRSDALLRRLVIYPFRELDVAFASLNQREREVLKLLFQDSHSGRLAITNEILAVVASTAPDAGPDMLRYLEREHWLTRAEDNLLCVNADRTPYLTFLRETESEGRRK
jgi:hypothetical protein